MQTTKTSKQIPEVNLKFINNPEATENFHFRICSSRRYQQKNKNKKEPETDPWDTHLVIQL